MVKIFLWVFQIIFDFFELFLAWELLPNITVSTVLLFGILIGFFFKVIKGGKK